MVAIAPVHNRFKRFLQKLSPPPNEMPFVWYSRAQDILIIFFAADFETIEPCETDKSVSLYRSSDKGVVGVLVHPALNSPSIYEDRATDELTVFFGDTYFTREERISEHLTLIRDQDTNEIIGLVLRVQRE